MTDISSLLETVTVTLLNRWREFFHQIRKAPVSWQAADGYMVYGTAWQHREQLSGVVFFTPFCLTHFYIACRSLLFTLLILYFWGSCWNNFFPLTSFHS